MAPTPATAKRRKVLTSTETEKLDILALAWEDAALERVRSKYRYDLKVFATNATLEVMAAEAAVRQERERTARQTYMDYLASLKGFSNTPKVQFTLAGRQVTISR